jgi:alkyl sulfatase BDS1-like metallo-beta-lactamase superfamily hydrolase
MHRSTYFAGNSISDGENCAKRARRFSLTSIAATLAAVSLGLAGSTLAKNHFNEKGSPASVHTSALQQALRDSLPFEDDRDFAESRRGFIAEPASKQILNAQGAVVWDMGQYDFLLSGEEFDSMHPSLQRQATLNMNFGLYEVVPEVI